MKYSKKLLKACSASLRLTRKAHKASGGRRAVGVWVGLLLAQQQWPLANSSDSTLSLLPQGQPHTQLGSMIFVNNVANAYENFTFVVLEQYASSHLLKSLVCFLRVRTLQILYLWLRSKIHPKSLFLVVG